MLGVEEGGLVKGDRYSDIMGGSSRGLVQVPRAPPHPSAQQGDVIPCAVAKTPRGTGTRVSPSPGAAPEHRKCQILAAAEQESGCVPASC